MQNFQLLQQESSISIELNSDGSFSIEESGMEIFCISQQSGGTWLIASNAYTQAITLTASTLEEAFGICYVMIQTV